MPDLLSPGERLIRCLSGLSVDRVPFGVGLGWSPWGATLERWRKETGRADLEPGREFGFDKGFVSPNLKYGIYPGFERKVLEETSEFIVARDERGITRRDLRGGSSMPEWLDYPIHTPKDWEELKSERLRPEDEGRVGEDLSAFARRVKEQGLAVQVGAFPWGVFGTPRDLMGVENLLISFYDEPEMIHDMMNHLTNLWIALWTKVAEVVPIAHIHIWEDMSGRNGSLISPDMIRAFMMPCYDRIASFAAHHRIPLISVDSDGDVKDLVAIMTTHGVNVFFPFEVQAGCDILEYRQAYPELGILYGLDKRALAGSRGEVEREVVRAKAMLDAGRYIPGFDHLIAPDATWENFRFAALAIKELCAKPWP